MLNSGRLIESIRQRYGISQSELRYGVCSKGQLTKIESGENSAEKLQYECLYQRLGKYSGRFESLLDLDEYELLEKRWTICDSIDNSKYDEAKSLIKDYKTIIKKYEKKININLHRQYMCLAECEIMHRNNEDIEMCMSKLMEGINCTYPVFDICNIDKYLLSRMELYLIEQYARYMELSGEAEKAVQIYGTILKKVDSERYDRSEREIHYRHVGYWLMTYYIKKGDYIAAFDIGKKTYEHTVNGGFVRFLTELMEGIIICEEKQGNDKSQERCHLNVLKRMNESFGVKGAEGFFPRYVEDRAYNVNEIITQRRKMLGLTQEELADGICSKMTVCRMEKNMYTLQKAKKEGMLRKVHLSGDKYIAAIDAYDYKVFELYNEMRDMIDKGYYDKAEELLCRIETEYRFESSNNELFFFNCREELLFMKNGRFSKSIDEMKDKLKISLGDIDKVDTKEVFLLENEWRIIDNIAVCSEKEKRYIECMEYLRSILYTYSEDRLHNNPYICLYIKRRVGDVLGEMGIVEEANNQLIKGIDVCCKLELLPYIHIMSYIYAWNILEMKHNISDKERNICKKMLEFAYVVSQIYLNHNKKELINKICKKHEIILDII